MYAIRSYYAAEVRLRFEEMPLRGGQVAHRLAVVEEVEDVRHQREPVPAAQVDRVSDVQVEEGDRITSYNVCYTKLLRCRS